MLTFEYGVDPLGVARGDIVICVPVLAREAREQRKDFLHHAAHLTLHGVLHALGYDHVKARDAKRMEALKPPRWRAWASWIPTRRTDARPARRPPPDTRPCVYGSTLKYRCK